MAIKLTSAEFFTSKLDESFDGLFGISKTFTEKGEAAAEKQFADFIKSGALDTEKYYKDSPVPELTDKLLLAGEKILDGWLSSCGVPMHFPNREVDWFANPTYNKYAEWTWQLSRHPEWSTLASLYRATGDEKYAAAFEDYFMSWCEQTEEPEYGTSGFATLAWRTLECGLRLGGTWLYAIMAFSSSKTIKDHTYACFFRSVWENVDRILHATTSHNWLVSEMNGIDACGVAYPFFKESAEWETYAIKRLTEQFDVQIYDDGFQFELTTGYHKVVINEYKRVVERHEKMGTPLSGDFKEKVANLYRIYIKLMMPDKRSPDFNDGGRIDVPGVSREVMAFMPDFRSEFEYIGEGRGEKPSFNSVLMPWSGYAVMRSGWETEDSCAILESAPYGFAHQHEDKLQVLIHAKGKRLLDDPGSFRYDTSSMRKYILSSYSHNTALVDGCGQNRRAGHKWKKGDLKKPADIKANFAADTEAAEGFYNQGYGEKRLDVRHERTLIWHKSGLGDIKIPFYTVYDKFIPADGEEHTYTALWHLGEVEEKLFANKVTADYGDGVMFDIIGMSAPRIVKGQETPVFMGWKPNHTPGDNPHYPTPTVNFDLKGTVAAMVSVLVPRSEEDINPIEAVACDTDANITITAFGKNYTFNKNDLF